jgi:hypothetical protein
MIDTHDKGFQIGDGSSVSVIAPADFLLTFAG